MGPITLDDDGFVQVRIGDAEQRLDLYDVYNHLQEVKRRTDGKPGYEFHAAVCGYLKGLGYPECSHRLADRFAVEIAEAVGRLSFPGGGGPNPGSPASTAPESSS
jgi:hypothetical protein